MPVDFRPFVDKLLVEKRLPVFAMFQTQVWRTVGQRSANSRRTVGNLSVTSRQRVGKS